MSKLICPECKQQALERQQGQYVTEYRDQSDLPRPLEVPGISWFKCSNCGEEVLDDGAMSAIEAARRRKMGLLAPENIRQLRATAGKTQVGMARLLGIGDKTYCRWESGSYIQSEAFDRYLRLLLIAPENLEVLEEIVRAKEEGAEPGVEASLGTAFFIEELEGQAALVERGEVFTSLLVQGSLLN